MNDEIREKLYLVASSYFIIIISSAVFKSELEPISIFLVYQKISLYKLFLYYLVATLTITYLLFVVQMFKYLFSFGTTSFFLYLEKTLFILFLVTNLSPIIITILQVLIEFTDNPTFISIITILFICILIYFSNKILDKVQMSIIRTKSNELTIDITNSLARLEDLKKNKNFHEAINLSIDIIEKFLSNQIRHILKLNYWDNKIDFTKTLKQAIKLGIIKSNLHDPILEINNLKDSKLNLSSELLEQKLIGLESILNSILSTSGFSTRKSHQNIEGINFELTIKNITKITPDKYTFDITIKNTGDREFEIASLQFGIFINKSFTDSLELIVNPIKNTTQLQNNSQAPKIVRFFKETNQIRIAGTSLVGSGNGSIIFPFAEEKLISSFEIIGSKPFTSPPIFEWCFHSSMITTATLLCVYEEKLNIPLDTSSKNCSVLYS